MDGTGDHRPTPVINALTVDVEDWVQSVYDGDRALTGRFVASTHRVLELFAEHDVRATFFVLGLAARRAPELVRRIHAAGHEIGSHGYGHRLVHTLSPAELRRDLSRSRDTLQDLIQAPVTAYRAPAFSLGRHNFTALDVIAECGYEVDASICPVRTPRYGVAGAPRAPHRIVTPSGACLAECPVTTGRLLGRRVPMGGGGFLRLFPSRWVCGAFERLNASGSAGTLYMHPYEFAPDELRALCDGRREGLSIPWRMRLHQGLGRRSFGRKVDLLLRRVRFGPVRVLAEGSSSWPAYRYTADGRIEQAGVIKQAEALRAAHADGDALVGDRTDDRRAVVAGGRPGRVSESAET